MSRWERIEIEHAFDHLSGCCFKRAHKLKTGLIGQLALPKTPLF